jgi:hypothetical protein
MRLVSAPLRRCATRTAELLHESRLADTTTAAEPDQAAVFRVPHSLQLVAKDPQLAIASNKDSHQTKRYEGNVSRAAVCSR